MKVYHGKKKLLVKMQSHTQQLVNIFEPFQLDEMAHSLYSQNAKTFRAGIGNSKCLGVCSENLQTRGVYCIFIAKL